VCRAVDTYIDGENPDRIHDVWRLFTEVREVLRDVYGKVVKHYVFRGASFRGSKHYTYIERLGGLKEFFLHALLDVFEECMRPHRRSMRSLSTPTPRYWYYIYFYDADEEFRDVIDEVKSFLRSVEVLEEVKNDLRMEIIEKHYLYPNGTIYVLG